MISDLTPEIDLLRNWILQIRPNVRSVGDDDELIESRVLDSFALLEFVFFVEEVFGREIVLDESVAKNFRTLASICRHFKEEVSNVEREDAY
jgi:acyl carrier protein